MRVSEVNVCQPHGIETSHRRTKSSEGTSSQSECDVRLGQKQTSRHLQADINRVHRAFRYVPIDIPVLCEWKSPERETDNPYYPSRSSLFTTLTRLSLREWRGSQGQENDQRNTLRPG
jgi:hypothetical protein